MATLEKRTQGTATLEKRTQGTATLEKRTQGTATPKSEGVLETGAFIGTHPQSNEHLDVGLTHAIALFFNSLKYKPRVLELGCGFGQVVAELTSKGISIDGYDGNPDTPKITAGRCSVLDLTVDFAFNPPYDWVLCLEVCEHIPAEFEKTVVANLHRANTKGIILSWAKKGQGGLGHFNEQDNDYVKKVFHDLGYHNNIFVETVLRNSVNTCSWFKDTVMVFEKV